jgi:hypothetical protein
MTRSGRTGALVIAAAALAIGGAACSAAGPESKPSPSPGRSAFAARDADAMALVTQCALSRHAASVVSAVNKADAGQPARLRFTEGGNLQLTKANYPTFVEWFQSHAGGLTIGGKRLGDWQQAAASSGRLPAAVCGPGISAKQLHDQVFAQYPTALENNPWSR